MIRNLRRPLLSLPRNFKASLGYSRYCFKTKQQPQKARSGWYMPVNPALQRQRQENCKSKTSQGHRVRPCQKRERKGERGKEEGGREGRGREGRNQREEKSKQDKLKPKKNSEREFCLVHLSCAP